MTHDEAVSLIQRNGVWKKTGTAMHPTYELSLGEFGTYPAGRISRGYRQSELRLYVRDPFDVSEITEFDPFKFMVSLAVTSGEAQENSLRRHLAYMAVLECERLWEAQKEDESRGYRPKYHVGNLHYLCNVFVRKRYEELIDRMKSQFSYCGFAPLLENVFREGPLDKISFQLLTAGRFTKADDGALQNPLDSEDIEHALYEHVYKYIDAWHPDDSTNWDDWRQVIYDYYDATTQ